MVGLKEQTLNKTINEKIILFTHNYWTNDHRIYKLQQR